MQLAPSLTNLLGIAAALIGVYIAFALLASWLNERIASWLQLRAKTLLGGIERMVGTEAAAGVLASPFVRAASGRQSGRGSNVTRAIVAHVAPADDGVDAKRRPPSYLSAGQFAYALFEWLESQRQTNLTQMQSQLAVLLDAQQTPALPDDVRKALAALAREYPSGEDLANALADYDPGPELAQLPDLEAKWSALRALAAGTSDAFTAALDAKATAAGKSLRNLLNTIPDDALRRQLLTIFRTAEGDVAKFESGVRTWFDDQMDRVSGWYQRGNQWKLIIIALCIAFAFNVDSIAIFERLAANPPLVSAGTQYAQALAAQHPGSITVPCAAPAKSAGSSCAHCPDGFVAAGNACTLDTSYLLQLPLGWDWKVVGTEFAGLGTGVAARWWLAFKLLGLVLSALAISLGAPFWFNVLAGVTSVRSAGPKPQRSDAVLEKPAAQTR